MMAQEAIEFDAYFRCYVLGRERVRIMQYDPKQPHHLRYVQDHAPLSEQFNARLHRDAIALCEALGYDMNTVELAVRDGVPYAIDFMNCAPDADRSSVGDANFEWVVNNMAEVLMEIVEGDQPFELTGSNGRSPSTISISTSAMLFTTHSKFASPTELRSASGAQFMKSMAYGTPSRTASSTVFMS